MITVFGIDHFPSAGRYSEEMIAEERPDVVALEIHQENLESLVQLVHKRERTPEEDKRVRRSAGDGLVAAITAAEEIGARLVGPEPSKEGYYICDSDFRDGPLGRLLRNLDKWFAESIMDRLDELAHHEEYRYQTSRLIRWATLLERLIYRYEQYPAYKRVSLDREKAYAERLLACEKEERIRLGREPRIFFFVGRGHKWNTERLIKRKANHLSRDSLSSEVSAP